MPWRGSWVATSGSAAPSLLRCSAAALAALYILAWCGALAVAAAAQLEWRPDTATAALVTEVRHSFTLNGKPIPPQIFRDFGDGDLADSGDIWITMNVAAATGSNLYYDDIKKEGGWLVQKRTAAKGNDGEEVGYSFSGATENGLLVVISYYYGGGSGRFYWLHILDLAPARAFNIEGKFYWQIRLTAVRTVPLGDRWNGDVSISKNTIRIVTIRDGPADDSGKRRTKTIKAQRP
jgi:hypothetical protein